jgi:hypothetical protein
MALRKYYRFLDGLRKFAQARMEPAQAVELAHTLLRQRIADREARFLQLVERGIYNHPDSPYLPLLSSRKIGLSDLRAWISGDGLETTLHRLESEGVYFTVDEFKGKKPIQRNGIKLQCREAMFDNPFLGDAYEVRSGATRSAGTRIRIDFEYLHQRSLYDAFLLDVHACLTAPVANWFPIFPGAPGINSSLRFAHIGNPVQRWFSQVAEDQVHVNWEKRLGTKAIFAVHRLCRNPLAEPEFADLQDARRLAHWAAEALQENAHCVIYTFAASAVRICNVAADLNLNLAGAKFFVTGEPLTAHKKEEIEAVGAAAVPVYGISEAGVIAAGCGRANRHADHCHLYKDTTAIIRHRQVVPNFDVALDEYLFTTLLYESPKLLLNVGMGDYGDLNTGDCSCPFTEIGFDSTLGDIRSYEKLTGEGVTFVDTDFVRIVEKELPLIFGGRSTDYQLIEAEDADGFTRLQLLISPRLGSINENRVLETFMTLLRRGEDSPESWAQSGVEMWRQTGMVRVTRRDPIPTKSGKILPFHLSETLADAKMPVRM